MVRRRCSVGLKLSHEKWDTHIIVNWMEREHMLGITYCQQGEVEAVDLMVADCFIRSGVRAEMLRMRPMKSGSVTPRVLIANGWNS